MELRYEHNKDMKTRVSIYKDNKKEKLESLKEIKAILGIKYTFDKVELSKETLGKVGSYCKTNLEKLKVIWGLDLRNILIGEEWTDKKTLGVLTQIWGNWGYHQIKRGKRRQKRVNGVLTEISSFNIQPTDKYTIFDEHCFDRSEYIDNPDNVLSTLLEEPCFLFE